MVVIYNAVCKIDALYFRTHSVENEKALEGQFKGLLIFSMVVRNVGNLFSLKGGGQLHLLMGIFFTNPQIFYRGKK
tara:strand:- start:4038 stop:4265 length:228 start_codon:yes stop_codon:yes gene_type:complete